MLGFSLQGAFLGAKDDGALKVSCSILEMALAQMACLCSRGRMSLIIATEPSSFILQIVLAIRGSRDTFTGLDCHMVHLLYSLFNCILF